MRKLAPLYIIFILLFPSVIFLSFTSETSLLSIAMAAFIVSGLILGVFVHRQTVNSKKEAWGARIKNEESMKQAKAVGLSHIRSLEADIRDKELKIVGLYEITKKMSGSLKFEDVFGVLSVFLKENFVFGNCSLVILKQDNTRLCVEKVLRVYNEKTRESENIQVNYNELARILSVDLKMMYLTVEDNSPVLKDLGVQNESVKTFLAMPLLSGNNMVAMLTIDNITKPDIDKFVILSTQFALEIKRVLLYEAVEALAITDGLTGLFVRRYFLDRVREELSRSKRYHYKFAVLMLDIDDFKSCNDTYGHLVGDMVLKDISRILKEGVREIDLVARYGGEEFAIVLPETDREGARLVAERIRLKIAETIFKAYDEQLRMKASIGISFYPRDSNDVKGLIDKADEALYRAKRGGKNIVCEY